MFQDHFAATAKMAYFGSSCAKIAFSTSPRWHYVCGFREIRSIFKNPSFAKSKRATPKHKNADGCGRRNKFWPSFEDRDFELRGGHFKIGNMKTPVSIFLHSARKFQLHTHSNPAKDERPKICFRVPRRRRMFCAPVTISGAMLNPTHTVEIGVFWHRTLRAPFLNACL